MKKTLTNLAFSGTMLMVSAAPLLAQPMWHRGGGHNRPHSVPEIDASAGLLAVAAVLAILAFAWERRRRAA